MKTVRIEIYEFSELSPKSQENARDWYRQDPHLAEHVAEECLDTIKEFCKSFRIRYRDICLDPQEISGEFPELSDDETIGDFIRERLARLPKSPYPLTGCFYDEIALDPLNEHLDNTSTDSRELRDILKNSVYDVCLAFQREQTEIYSDSSIDEMISINEYSFTADGRVYR